MPRFARLVAVCAAVCGTACAPTFDWREFVPEGTDLAISFPCRPDRDEREVTVAGAKVRMEMIACSAGDTTFALAFIDIADPARIGATLAALRAGAAENLRSTPQNALLQIGGMTPNEQSARVQFTGTRPDGSEVREHAAFFTRGLRVYQATVIGASPAPQIVDTFMTGMKFR